MAKMTKTQVRRMINDIESKAKKLFIGKRSDGVQRQGIVVTTKDMEAIEKLCKKWLKRIG